MSTHRSPVSHRLNRTCAALVALSLVAGCSKGPAAPQAAAPLPADASAPMTAPVNAQNDSAQYAAPGQPAMPVQGSPAPTQRTAATYSNANSNAPTYASNGGAGGDGQPYYDAGDGQSGGPEQVVSTYVDPPLAQPAPVAVDWAPPPMLVEEPPPQPGPNYVWTGGYWDWQGRWVWAAGRWAAPPRPDYGWQEPYYEHRQDKVVYVPGYWSAPHTNFIAPAIGIVIIAAIVAVGVHHGHAPEGPQGCFVPPPPGSRPGLIVPAPIGTSPAVVIGAPPVIRTGMRVEGNVENNSHNRTYNDNRVTNNVTNITNVRNVTIIAPQGATANGQAFQHQVPAQSHLAAAQQPVVRVAAPMPVSKSAIPSYQAGRPPANLPPPQAVRRDPPPNVANAGQGGQPQQHQPDPRQPSIAQQAGQPPRHGEPPQMQGGQLPGQPPQVQAPPQGERRQGGPMTARPDPGQTPDQLQQAQAQQRAQQAAQQRAQQAAQQHAQQQQQQQQQQQLQAQQQAEQQRQRGQQAEQQQRAQQAAQQKAQEQQQQQRQAQQAEQQQRSQQAEQQQRAQQAAQQQAAQHAQQAEQQRGQQAEQQRGQQAAEERAQQQRAQQAEQQRGQQPAPPHAPPAEPPHAQPAEQAQAAKADEARANEAKAQADRAKQASEEKARRDAHPADKTTEDNRK